MKCSALHELFYAQAHQVWNGAGGQGKGAYCSGAGSCGREDLVNTTRNQALAEVRSASANVVLLYKASEQAQAVPASELRSHGQQALLLQL